MSDQKSFFSTVPGILSGLAAVITAAAGALIALHQAGLFGSRETATVTSAQATGQTPALTRPASEPAVETTDGWAIVGKARRGKFFDLDIMVPDRAPAPGRRYRVVNGFRLISRAPYEDHKGGQTVTLGLVRRGDSVELLEVYVPAPSTELQPVWAKLRAVLHPE